MLVCIYESIKGKKKRKLGEAGSKDEEKSSSHFLCVTKLKIQSARPGTLIYFTVRILRVKRD